MLRHAEAKKARTRLIIRRIAHMVDDHPKMMMAYKAFGRSKTIEKYGNLVLLLGASDGYLDKFDKPSTIHRDDKRN